MRDSETTRFLKNGSETHPIVAVNPTASESRVRHRFAAGPEAGAALFACAGHFVVSLLVYGLVWSKAASPVGWVMAGGFYVTTLLGTILAAIGSAYILLGRKRRRWFSRAWRGGMVGTIALVGLGCGAIPVTMVHGIHAGTVADLAEVFQALLIPFALLIYGWLPAFIAGMVFGVVLGAGPE